MTKKNTPRQDTLRHSKEIEAAWTTLHDDATSHWTAPTDDRYEARTKVAFKFAAHIASTQDNRTCEHIPGKKGNIEIWMHPAFTQTVCNECLPTELDMIERESYINSANCDWCEKLVTEFYDMAVTVGTVHITGSLCPACLAKIDS